jgi:uridine kinase
MDLGIPLQYLRKFFRDTHILIIDLAFICFSLDADVRLARRIKRDTLEKDRDIKTVLDQVNLTLLYSFRLEIT